MGKRDQNENTENILDVVNKALERLTMRDEGEFDGVRGRFEETTSVGLGPGPSDG